MSTQGPNSPGTAADDATVGVTAWSNPNNAKVQDSVNATAIRSNGTGIGQTHYLLVSNFGFTIPTNATINGIAASVVYSANNAGFDKDTSVKLSKGGVIGGTNKATNAIIANGTLVYGSVSDLWGQTWTPTDVNASNFGFAFSTTIDPTSFNQQDQVDYISITITYTYLVLTADQGSYTLTGNATALSKGYNLIATVGLYVLTGQLFNFSSLWTRLAKSVSTFTNQNKSS